MTVSEIIPLLVAAVGGTAWIVKAIYSVRDEVRDMRIAMEEDIRSVREELRDHVNDYSIHRR